MGQAKVIACQEHATSVADIFSQAKALWIAERPFLSGLHMLGGGDRTGWLGREDSNLRMAESKSSYFACSINGHSEN
jgi:hypothetical protein